MKTLLKLILVLLTFNAHAVLQAFGVRPLFLYGGMNQIKTYKNLTNSYDNFNLDLDINTNGFLVSNKEQFALSIALAKPLSDTIENIPVTPVFGLAPETSIQASFTNYYKNLEEEDTRLLKFIPINESGLEKLNIGDAIQFDFYGGISALFGPSAYMSSAGIKFTHYSGWNCYISKIDQDKIYVELNKNHGFGGGAYIKSPANGWDLNRRDIEFNGAGFIINFKTQEGALAYKNFLKGSLDKIVDNNESIIKTKTTSGLNDSYLNKFQINFPFIPVARFVKSKEIKVGEEKVEDIYNTNDNTFYALSISKKEVRAFGIKKIIDTAFLIKNSSTNKVTEMQLMFNNMNNLSTSKKLFKIKSALQKITGLFDFLDFNVNDNENLKFVQVQLGVNLGKKMIESLENHSDKLKLALEQSHPIHYSDKNRIKDFIKFLDDKKIQNDKKENYRSIAKLGQKFWNSPFMFKLNLELIKKCGGEISYEVSGKRISRLLRKVEYTQGPECPL